MKWPVMPWSGMGYEMERAAKCQQCLGMERAMRWIVMPWNEMGYEMPSNALEWNGL